MEKLKDKLQSLSNEIDNIIGEAKKDLPKGVSISTIGQDELKSKSLYEIPKGGHISFIDQ